MSGPVLVGDYMYGIDNNKLVCMEWKTGEKKWEEKSVGKGRMMDAGDKMIVLSEKGRMIIAQATEEKFVQVMWKKYDVFL